MTRATDKPAHLNLHNASAFQEQSVVHAYQYRPQYPLETFEHLAALMSDSTGRVLDVGCGTGFVARPLVDFVGAVDAVDISLKMIEQGRRLANGDHPNLRWFVARAEEVALAPPYELITAGESLHWMDWETVMPHFADLLTPNGVLAILTPVLEPLPWDADLKRLIATYSTMQNFQSFDLVAELEQRQLFQKLGVTRTGVVAVQQTLESYIESFHGRAFLSRKRISAANSAAFDAAVRNLVLRFTPDELELRVSSEIIWGKPLKLAAIPD